MFHPSPRPYDQRYLNHNDTQQYGSGVYCPPPSPLHGQQYLSIPSTAQASPRHHHVREDIQRKMEAVIQMRSGTVTRDLSQGPAKDEVVAALKTDGWIITKGGATTHSIAEARDNSKVDEYPLTRLASQLRESSGSLLSFPTRIVMALTVLNVFWMYTYLPKTLSKLVDSLALTGERTWSTPTRLTPPK